MRAKNLSELFARAAEALLRIQSQPAAKFETLTRLVEVRGFDRETLLVNWLNEILYLQEANKEAYSSVEILEISEDHLKAKLRGQPDSPARQIIKAVTFHGLHIRETRQGLEAQVVVDV